MNLLPVVLGGGVGAGGRYLPGGWVHSQSGTGAFPWGTSAVNFLGSLVVGSVFGLARHGLLSREAGTLFLTVGVPGGFTTFSALSHDTFRLLSNGEAGASLPNAGGQLLPGIAAVYVGFVLVRAPAAAV